MIRNYNGNVNRSAMRDLRKLCDVNAKNERILFEAFDQKGEKFIRDFQIENDIYLDPEKQIEHEEELEYEEMEW